MDMHTAEWLQEYNITIVFVTKILYEQSTSLLYWSIIFHHISCHNSRSCQSATGRKF